jgi:hypothetical protein
VQHLSLAHFDHRNRDAFIGRQLWVLTESLHSRINKNIDVQRPLEDIDSVWYVCETIVLLMQIEYKIKYNTAFWSAFQYQTLDVQATEYLLKSEMRVFDKEWNVPISGYKCLIRDIINE